MAPKKKRRKSPTTAASSADDGQQPKKTKSQESNDLKGNTTNNMNSESGKVQGILQSMEIDMKQSILSLSTIVSQPRRKIEILMQKFLELDKRKAHFSNENGVKDTKIYDWIELNISGRMMKYQRRIFLKYPDSILAGIFSGRWDKSFPKDKDGRFFLDENPSCFRYILNLLAEFNVGQFHNTPLLKSVADRYSLSDFLGDKVDIQQETMLGKANMTSALPTFPLDNTAVRTALLEIAEGFQAHVTMFEKLSQKYERDFSNFEKEVALMNEIIEDGKEMLELNVRGQYIATTRGTLQSVPDSMLSAKFDSSKWSFQNKKDTDSEGNIMIDADPSIFNDILEFLRSRKNGLEEIFSSQISDSHKEDLEKTLNYLFPGNADIGKVFTIHPEVDSVLIPVEHMSLAMRWCNETVSLPNAKLTLLYRASQDGWGLSTLLRKCNGKNNTLLVVSANGGVFGGFINRRWKAPNRVQCSASSFLFSLVPPSSDCGVRKPAKLVSKKPQVPSFNNFCIAFGDGSDLVIFFDHANSSINSSSNLGYFYQIPAGYFGDPKNYFAGSQYFKPDEIECFAWD